LARLGCIYSNENFFWKEKLAIAAKNVELPLFKNREHNSKSVFILNRGLTALTLGILINVIGYKNYVFY